MIFVVNNAMSKDIDRTFGSRILEKKIIQKNQIQYTIPYDNDLEQYARRIRHIGKQIYQSFENYPTNPRFNEFKNV